MLHISVYIYIYIRRHCCAVSDVGDIENRQNPMVVGFYGGNKQSGELPGYFKGYIDSVSDI